MSSNRVKHYAAMVLFLGIVQGCQQDAEIMPSRTLEVATYVVEQPVESQYRSFKGTVVAADLTPLAFRVEGKLEAIPVRTGQRVEKGELLARLDDSKLRQQMADAQARYELALRQLQRGQTLFERSMLSHSELDELTANKRIAEVKFKVANNNLKYTRLEAPFSGYISEIAKESYENVNPGEVIVSLYRDDVVRVRVHVSDTVMASIDPDARERNYRIKTTFSGDENIHYLQYYEHSSEPVDDGSSFEFLMQMPQTELPILPGTSASLNVDLREAGLSTVAGYVVPMTALDTGDKPGEFNIWKLRNNQVEKVAVNVLQVTREGAIVDKGVRLGDVLVNSALSRMRESIVVSTAEKGSKQ
jgi:RND family efflux transporter MFP subunit